MIIESDYKINSFGREGIEERCGYEWNGNETTWRRKNAKSLQWFDVREGEILKREKHKRRGNKQRLEKRRWWR